MARIFIDGFESGGIDLWDASSGVSMHSSSLIDGVYCLNVTGYTAYIYKDVTAASEMYFAFRCHPGSSTIGRFLSLWDGATVLIRLRREATNCLKAYVGTTLVGTGTAEVRTGVNYLIEVYIKIADTGGRYVVKVNGVTDIDFTGDTKSGTSTQFNRVRFGADGAYGPYCYIDNFIMDDADWIGNTNIQAVVPTAGGNSTGWTPSAGSNFACVDEIPVSDTDYVSINAVDTTDTYAAGNMVGTIGNVKCVQVQSRALVDGSPTPTNLKLVVRSGGTDYLSGDKVVPVGAKGLSHLWENNPADSAAWEEADVNAMEIGVKSAA